MPTEEELERKVKLTFIILFHCWPVRVLDPQEFWVAEVPGSSRVLILPLHPKIKNMNCFSICHEGLFVTEDFVIFGALQLML